MIRGMSAAMNDLKDAECRIFYINVPLLQANQIQTISMLVGSQILLIWTIKTKSSHIIKFY
jgi:hypothetical protein